MLHQRKPASPEAKPTFWLEGTLILLPVIVLVVFGFLSLRQDAQFVRHEATKQAQNLADSIADALWSSATNAPAIKHLLEEEDPAIGNESLNRSEPSGIFAFEVNARGELRWPSTLLSTGDSPHGETAFVPAELSNIWYSAQAAEREAWQFVKDDAWDRALAAYDDILKQKPPLWVMARAHYSSGLILNQLKRTADAALHFKALLDLDPTIQSDTGIPLRHLAGWKLLEPGITQLDRAAKNRLEELCSDLVRSPSHLSPYLLRKITELEESARVSASSPAAISATKSTRGIGAAWLVQWRKDEVARQLFTNAVKQWQETGGVRDLISMTNSISHWPRLFWLADGPNKLDESLVSPSAARSSTPLVVNPAENGTELPLAWLILRVDQADGGACFAGQPLVLSEAGTLSRSHWRRSTDQQGGVGNEAAVSANAALVGRPREGQFVSVLSEVLHHLEALPPHFGLTLNLAGRSLLQPNALPAGKQIRAKEKEPGAHGKSDGTDAATPLLARASRFERDIEYLTVGIYLASPELLFARQQARTLRFGLLLGASALAGLVGFFAAWRAFLRQQRLAELKSNFVSSVSHELRAPIGSVRLMAEGLLRGKLTDESKRREYCQFIVQECRRLSSLIENVLDLSRIEQGRKEYEFELTDLLALQEQTIQLMTPYAAERQIRLRATVEGEPYPIQADGRALQQALVNLIDNAIKFSPASTEVIVGVSFATTREERAKSSNTASNGDAAGVPTPGAELWVEDRGTGIPVADQGRIFDQFYRCGNELHRETQGIGIGLSIVRHIVEAHRGTISIRSAPGTGSRFLISLPGSAPPIPAPAETSKHENS